MFIFSHLVAGLTIGIILYWYFRDPVLIVASAIGSIIPDIIDKAVGIIVFASAIGGRIYIHGILFFLVVLIVGLTIWWHFHSFAGVALALGILSHQILDAMWKKPVNWYYPFLGPFPPDYNSNYLSKVFISELTNPSEWLFAGAVVLISIQILQFHGNIRHKRLISAITFVLTFILSISGIFMLYCGGFGLYCFLTGWKDPLNNILAGMVIIGVVAIVTSIEWKRRKE